MPRPRPRFCRAFNVGDVDRAADIKNGNLTFTTDATDPLTAPITVWRRRPNGNWTGVNPVVTVTSISLTIEQPVGTVLFTGTASNSSGPSGSVTLNC